jgi:ElaB/YqjD/DUF883 family membrane-anchored ribosome-binding protein
MDTSQDPESNRTDPGKLSPVIGITPQDVEQAKEQLRAIGRSVEEIIRQQPLPALLVAAGVGFFLGAILVRR